MRTYLVTGFAALACTFATPALSASVIFSGQDPGVGPGGPFPNSSAAEAAFLAAAGLVSTTVKTETFESATVGTFTPLVLDDFTITTTAANFGPPYSGVNNTTLGALYGFNTTPGGEKWYGFHDEKENRNSSVQSGLDNAANNSAETNKAGRNQQAAFSRKRPWDVSEKGPLNQQGKLKAFMYRAVVPEGVRGGGYCGIRCLAC